jgi:hypothetical protein
LSETPFKPPTYSDKYNPIPLPNSPTSLQRACFERAQQLKPLSVEEAGAAEPEVIGKGKEKEEET